MKTHLRLGILSRQTANSKGEEFISNLYAEESYDSRRELERRGANKTKVR